MKIYINCKFPHLCQHQNSFRGEWPCCIVANMLDCDNLVSKFKLQSSYYFHFWTNTLRKAMKPFIYPAMEIY